MNPDLEKLIAAYDAWQNAGPDQPRAWSKFLATAAFILGDRKLTNGLVWAIHKAWDRQQKAENKKPSALPPTA